MSLSSYLKRSLLTPPYRLAPVAIFIYVAVILFLRPQSPLWTSALIDPDDYMRLNETIDWLMGHGWYDLSQPRLSPGAETVIHWARLVDLPIAFVMWPFIHAFGMTKAALIASFLIPPAIFVLLLLLLSALARPLMAKSQVNLAAIYVIFSPTLLFNFTPGRVDHHNWEVLITGCGLYSLERMIFYRNGWRAGITGAIALTCGMWIGTEIMPYLLLIIGCLALFGGWRGGFALRNAAVFSGVMACTTAIALILACPLSDWSYRAVSWFSSANVIFSGLAGLIFIFGWLFGQHTSRRWLRLTLLLALSLQAAALYLSLVPEALAGPFADYDTYNATKALDDINEAIPVIRELHIYPYNSLSYINVFGGFLTDLFLPCVAFFFCCYAVLKTRSRQRQLWIIYAVFVGITTLLALLVQRRVLWFEQFFQLVPLAHLTFSWWKRYKERWPSWHRYRAGLIVLLLVGALPALIIPPLLAHFMERGTTREITQNACDLQAATTTLIHMYPDPHHTLMASVNDGPELLFRTPYNVVGANFDVSGNEDVYSFFNSRDDDKALEILRKWNIDVVLICHKMSDFYAGLDHIKLGENAFLRPRKDGKLGFTSNLEHPTLIERLVNKTPPSWLKLIEIPNDTGYLLFKVALSH